MNYSTKVQHGVAVSLKRGLTLLAILGLTIGSAGAKAQSQSIAQNVPVVPVSTGVMASGQLVWNRDINTALQLARNENKLVLVDVYTGWCGWCKRLDRDTYSDPSVVSFLNNGFVSVKIDAEDGGAGQAFAQKYGVRGYPAIAVLDGSGKLRGIFYGYRGPKEFPAAVSKVAGGASAE